MTLTDKTKVGEGNHPGKTDYSPHMCQDRSVSLCKQEPVTKCRVEDPSPLNTIPLSEQLQSSRSNCTLLLTFGLQVISQNLDLL